MKKFLFKQKGVVLVFTMVMLVLLTLVAINMIQANKQELAMSSNVRQQTVAFANVESQAANYAEILRQFRVDSTAVSKDDGVTPLLNSCHSIHQIDEGKFFSSDPSDKSDQAEDKELKALTDGVILPPDSITTVEVFVTEVSCRFKKSNNMVEQRCVYLDGVRDSTNTACKKLSAAGNKFLGCPNEIYTISVVSTDKTGAGTQRRIDSKYAVNCEGSTPF